MNRGRWTPVLATMFLAILVWCLVYTEQLVSAFRAETATMTRIYAEVQGGLADPNEQAADRALFRLQDIVVGSGVPLILSGPADTILAAANLPFPAETSTAEGQERIGEYARRSDARWPPVGNPAQDAVSGLGGPITMRAFPGDPGSVTLQVHDTGPGVGSEIRDRLFEPGATTKSGGWGVVLPLAKRIVERIHGGRIELVRSGPRGSTFQLRLRAYRSDSVQI